MQDLTGKVAIVTGANTGIGYHTALELARNNAHVIVAARNPTKGKDAVSKIIQEVSQSGAPADELEDRVQFLSLDLSSLASVKAFATSFLKLNLPIDMLVLNAGVMKSPGAEFVGKNLTYGFDVTEDGFESHIGINHIGHFYLTQLLEDKLVASAPSRVVSVSSMAEQNSFKLEGIRFESFKPETSDAPPSDYEDGVAYSQSKLANILFARELASRLEDKGVTAYSCHPGVIKTDLFRYFEEETARDLEESQQGPIAGFVLQLLGTVFEAGMFEAADGALAQLHLATANATTLQNGQFYHPIGKLIGSAKHPQGTNVTLQKLLWTETERMIAEAGF